MAVQDTRAVVRDPLALNVGQVAPERNLPLTAIRNPGQSAGDAVFDQQRKTLGALDGLNKALGGFLETKKEDYVTEGKMRFMQGATEDQIAAEGNLYIKQGWESLNVVDKANTWFLQEQGAIKESGYQTDPETYKQGMMQRRAEFMKNLPDDPAIRKLYVAQFDDLGPRLASTHFNAHNEYNKQRTGVEFENMIGSGARANSDASVRTPGKPLAMSPGQVRTTFAATPVDRDVLIRTVIGEAAGEDDEGQAAVAHVVLNRVQDGGYMGSTIAAVAKAPKQFSAWNSGAGGNSLVNKSPDSPAYQRAAKIVDAVLSGRHADPTNGATHYYSPAGMVALVNEGSQGNLVPTWWNDQVKASGGSVQIGGHKFAGKARNSPVGGVENAGDQVQAAAGGEPVHPAIVKKWEGTSDKALAEYANGGDTEAAQVLSMRSNGRGTGSIERRPLAPPEALPGSGRELAAGPNDRAQAAISVAPGANPVVAAAAQGVATRETPSGPTPQLRANILGFKGLTSQEKGDKLANAIIKDLAGDSDQVFRDAGGIGLLNELGANSALTRQVLNAKKQFDQRNLNKFSADERLWENSVYDKIASGEMTEEQAIRSLEGRVKDGTISDARAQAIANKVVTEGKRVGKQYNMSNEVMGGAARIMSRVAGGELEAPEAADLVRKLSEQHDVPVAQLNGFIKEVWNEKEKLDNERRTKMAAAYKEHQKEVETDARIRSAIGDNFGLDGVDGHIKMTDNSGNKVSVSAPQAGARMIMQKEYALAQKTIDKMLSDPSTTGDKASIQARAEADADVRIYGQLRGHNVVAEGVSGAISAALGGAVVGKDGKVEQSAVKAFDWYMRMSNNPEVGSAYADRYFKDEASRNLAQTAKTLFAGGGMDPAQALSAAHQQLNTKMDNPDVKLVSTAADFDTRVTKVITDKWRELQGSSGMFSIPTTGLTGPNSVHPVAMDQAKFIIGRNADLYRAKNPATSDEVNIAKATDDYINNSFIVGKNIVYGKDTAKLDVVMGVEGLGRDAPDRAIRRKILEKANEAVENYKATSKDPHGWGKYFRKEGLATTNSVLSTDQLPMPDYQMQYNPATGQATIMLPDKLASDGKTVVKTTPLILSLSAVGAEWKKAEKYGKREDDGGIFGTIAKSVRSFVATGAKDAAKNYSGADMP